MILTCVSKNQTQHVVKVSEHVITVLIRDQGLKHAIGHVVSGKRRTKMATMNMTFVINGKTYTVEAGDPITGLQLAQALADADAGK